MSDGEVDGDAGARRTAVRDFTRPLLLEAGAGTGKTATLVGRVVAWCIGPGWDEAASERPDDEDESVASRVFEGVSAITFTEAAAAEMTGRVGRVLGELETAGPDGVPVGLVAGDLPRDTGVWAPRAHALRASLDRLTTCTIHAFCRRLLAAHPLELGLDPYFELDARMTRLPLCVREVLEEYLSERWRSGNDADLLELARRGYGPPDIELALLGLLDDGARAVDFEDDPLAPDACAELCRALLDSFFALLELTPSLVAVPKNQKTHAALKALQAAAAFLIEDAEDPRTQLAAWQPRLAEVFTADARKKLKEWRKGKLTQNELKRLPAPEDFAGAAARLEAALGPFLELDAEHLERVRKLANDLLSRVEERLRTRGLATFSDLLRDAQRLLTQHPEVAAHERRRIRQLLVDEFQDTDELQCDIVRQLGLRGDPDERPVLFCVGDPKQSIYAWRNADLMAYDAFTDEVVAEGGEVLRLTRNFRSIPAILDETNRSVAPIMQRVPGVQPEFVALEPHRGAPRDAGPAVEIWASWPLERDGFVTSIRNRMQRSYQVEAAAIAADVARLASEGVAYRDFGLLFRSQTGVEVYLRALREARVPYVVQSDRTYYRRREVIDAAALVRALLDPTDQIALVTLLRSPWVGIPDAAIFALWAQGFPSLVARLTFNDHERLEELRECAEDAVKESMPESIPEAARDWPTNLAAALHAIAELRASFETEPADRWIDRVRELFLPEVLESARFLGAFRRANLVRFFRELETAFEERGDQHTVLTTLRTNLGREVQDEVTRPSDSEVDAVRVLTIHGAKGLEFPHVYLTQLHRPPPSDRLGETFFERRAAGIAYALLGAHSPSSFAAAQRAEQAEAAERVRLLYVALTRARERLVLVGAFAPEPKRQAWHSSRTFAELLEHRAGLEEALRAVLGSGPDAAVEDGLGAIVRAAVGLAPEDEGERARAARRSAGELPSVAAIAEDERLITDWRAAARRRQARPLSRAASEDHAEPTTAAGGPRTGLSRRASQAVGEAVHRALELSDLQADRSAEFERAHASLAGFLHELLGAAELDAAAEHASALLDGVRANGLWDRLFDLGPTVIARELDVLLPPNALAEEDDAPLGYIAGAIDLLYREPEGGRLIIVDFKTDFIEGDAALHERVELYRSQGRAYVRALTEALQPDIQPRFELWFLHPGRVEEVSI